MDIAYFISDLLGEQGELSVPNLGYFVQMRMSAYYNEQEKKFYPPHYAVQFDPQVIDDDDTLAAHITERKKISLASAKYFIEKYITGLREQALNEDVPFGGIGYFSTNGIQLVFRPDQKTDDPAFFGFKPLDAYRIGQDRPATVVPPAEATPERIEEQPVAELSQPAFVPVAADSIATPPNAAYTPVEQPVKAAFPEQIPIQTEVEQEYAYEEERRGISPWLIVAIVLLVLVAAAAALYKFKPELFSQLSLHKDPYQNTAVAVKDSANNADTVAVTAPVTSAPETVAVQTTTPKVDTVAAATTKAETPAIKAPEKTETKPAVTTAKKAETKPAATAPVVKSTPAPVVATPTTTVSADANVPKGKWVIYGGAFPERKPAVRALENYKSLGQVQARFLKDNVKQGNNYKIILGVFDSKSEAEDARKEILATAKISASRLGVEQLK